MIAVLLQYELPSGFVHGLVPTALTIDATHDGPPVFLTSLMWSELNEFGITQETPRSLQFVEMSDKTADGLNSTFEVHCVPVHFRFRATQMCLIAFGAIQMPLAVEVHVFAGGATAAIVAPRHAPRAEKIGERPVLETRDKPA